MKTLFVKPVDVERKWYLVDAEGKVLGRLASRVVGILRGKNKPLYAPHWDLGAPTRRPSPRARLVPESRTQIQPRAGRCRSLAE